MGMCQSTRRYCVRECPCLFTKYERTTEMKKTSRSRRPKDVQESKSNVIVHDMLPVETPLCDKTHSKNTRPHSLPTLRQHIFINIEASPRTRTPSTDSMEEWTTPRSETSPYCRLRRDSNENTCTFMIDDEKVKDVYVNYEKIRSRSL